MPLFQFSDAIDWLDIWSENTMMIMSEGARSHQWSSCLEPLLLCEIPRLQLNLRVSCQLLQKYY